MPTEKFQNQQQVDESKLPNTSFNGNIESFLENIYSRTTYVSQKKSTNILKYFNDQLFKYFNPDINGFTLAFLIPPPFLGLKNKNDLNFLNLINIPNVNSDTITLTQTNKYLTSIQKLVTFAATDFSPPQRTVNTERVSSRSGGIPYATEVEPSEQCTIQYIDNHDLDIFNFHCEWVAYIEELLQGILVPPGEYLNSNSSTYGCLDYAGSLYIVKYDPSLRNMKYLGKCTGIFPQSLPSKELIGSRQQNELTVLPFTYFVSYYEESINPHHPIWADFQNDITSVFRDV